MKNLYWIIISLFLAACSTDEQPQNSITEDDSSNSIQKVSKDTSISINNGLTFYIPDSCYILKSNGALPSLSFNTTKSFKDLIENEFSANKAKYVLNELPEVNCDIEGFYTLKGIFLKENFKLSDIEVLKYIEVPENFSRHQSKTFIYTFSTRQHLGCVWETENNQLNLFLIVNIAPCEG